MGTPYTLLSSSPKITGFVAGPANLSKVTVDFEVGGPRYRKLWIEATVSRATIAPRLADILDLTDTAKLKINGKVVREFTIGELDCIQTLYDSRFGIEVTLSTGRDAVTPAAGNTVTFRVPIYLREEWRPGMLWRDKLCWPTLWKNGYKLTSLQLELPLAPIRSTGGASSAHSLKVWADADDNMGDVAADGSPIFNISKWERIVQPYSAAADVPIPDITRDGLLQQVSLLSGYYTAAPTPPGTANVWGWQANDPISKLKVSYNKKILVEDVPAALLDAHNRKYEMNVAAQPAAVYGTGINVADQTHWIPEMSDDPINGDVVNLSQASSFIVTPTMASASATVKTVTLLVMRYGNGLVNL